MVAAVTLQLTSPALDIGIVVNDLDASLRFYRDTLQLEYDREIHVPKIGRLAFVSAGRSKFKLIQLDDAAVTPAIRGGLQGKAVGIRYCTLHVSGLAEALSRCVAGGYRVVMKPRSMGPGLTIAALEDPDGNWIELAEQVDIGGDIPE
jgi:catechol 2,3-dioxygenase-like lactoylglutathione lyase family enzyme